MFAKTVRKSTQLRGFLCAFFVADPPPLLRRSSCAWSLVARSIRCYKSIAAVRFPITVVVVDVILRFFLSKLALLFSVDLLVPTL